MIRALVTLALVVATSTSSRATDLPGTGPTSSECFAVLRSEGTTTASAPNRLECTDGDPGCDTDGDCHNGSCTFRVRACINQPITGCQAPAALRSLKVNPPGLGVPSPATLTGTVCGDAVDVVVPLGGKHKTKRGKRVVVLKAKAEGTKSADTDKDTLLCLPRPATEACPTTTSTTTTTTPRTTSTTAVSGSSTTTASTGTTTTTEGGSTSTTVLGTTTTSAIESTTTTAPGTTTTTTVSGSTTTTVPSSVCEPLVDDGQGIEGTYQLIAVLGPKLCQTNALQNRFGACTDDADCGGTAGMSEFCSVTPFATADGVVLPFPQGISTVFTIAQADSAPTCNHGACIECGNADGVCAGITGCGSTPGQPENGCIRNQCCEQPGFTIPTFVVPLLGGLCSRLDQYRCGFGAVNTSNPQVGDNEVTKTADTSDPGPDCEYGTLDDPAHKPCNTGGSGEGNDANGKVERTVGDGMVDAPGIHYRLAVPSLSTTWQDSQSPAGECTPGSTFEPGENLITQIVLNAEFTTAGATASFTDLNGDGCKRAGAGFTSFNHDGPFTLGSPPAMPQPYDSSTCAGGGACSIAVSAGIALTGGSPLFDTGFIAVLPNGPMTRLSTQSCSCSQTAGCPE